MLTIAGSLFEIRPIRPQDAALIVAAAAYTSDETYYRRFRVVSAASRRRAHIFHGRRRPLALCARRGAPRQRTSGRGRALHPGSRPSGGGSLAVVVHDPFQDRGLGAALVTALAAHACAHAIDTFQVIIGNGNVAMRQLLLRVFPDARVRECDGYDTEYFASVPGQALGAGARLAA